MLSVSLVRCKNEALKKLYFKSIIKCFKSDQIHHVLIFPIDYCARINALPARLFSGWYSVIDFLIVTASISKLLHSWLLIDLSEHHYTALMTSKLKKKLKSFLHDVKQCLYINIHKQRFISGIRTFNTLIAIPDYYYYFNYFLCSRVPVRIHEQAWKSFTVYTIKPEIWPKDKLPRTEFRLLSENWHPSFSFSQIVTEHR